MKRYFIIILTVNIITILNAQNIRSSINYILTLPNEERQETVDSLMDMFEPYGFPYLHFDTACFIYKNSASKVELAGGFTNWEWNAINMTNIYGTDFWYYYRIFDMEARLAYKYIINDGIWILDSLNPNTVIGGYGPDSELAMPEYVLPWEIKEYPGTPSGSSISHTLSSSNTGLNYQLIIYLPYNYNSDRPKSYPVAYFQDGFTYFNAMNADVVLNNLINEGLIDTLIAVFVKPNDRNIEYAGSLRHQYRKFFSEELVPFIDEHFNTIQNPSGRAVCGNSLGGNISALIGYYHPDVFGNCGVQQGAFPPNNYEVVYLVENGQVVDVKWASIWGFYDYLDESLVEFKNILISKDYDLHWLTLPQGHNGGLCIETIDELLIYFFPPGFSNTQEQWFNPKIQIYPNPFSTSTTIEYTLSQPQTITFTFFNQFAKEVDRIEQKQSAGKQQVVWTPELPDGMYYFRLEAGEQIESGKLVLVR